MNETEYRYSFAQWCNETQRTDIKLTEFGSVEVDYDNLLKYEAAKSMYHDFWMSERKAYVLQKKNEAINNALIGLKNAGIECQLKCYQNGHITAKTRHGTILSYYATSGTIAGYKDTSIYGLDEFIRLCKQ